MRSGVPRSDAGRSGSATRTSAWLDWGPAALVGAIVLVLTTAPLRGPEGAPEAAATLVHIAMFAAVGGALGWGWHRRGLRRPVLGPALVATAYGAMTEGIQLMLAHRVGDPQDVAADALGAFAGALALRWWVLTRTT